MKHSPFKKRSHRADRGAAIILVLCFLVLIAGLMVTFLFQASTERQVSNANANATKVELLGDTALGVVVDDLMQEIFAHSTVYGTGTNAVYVPTAAAYAVPQRYETIPNLLRRSSHTDKATRAANAVSTTASYNGRFVSLSRWNSHFLLPLAGSVAGDSTPATGFTAPDWVIVTRGGPVAGATWAEELADSAPSNTAYGIGRYAYAIYDEGGLLDVNAAGYPSSSAASQYGPKGGIAFTDLQQLSLTASEIDQLVGWRNYGTTQPAGNFPSFTFSAAAATRYVTQVTGSTNSFLTASGTVYNGNSDHTVMNRQQLIKLMQGMAKSTSEQSKLQGALQYLGTFSREVNGPTYGPPVDYTAPYNYKSAQFNSGSTVYNPFLLGPRVQTVFTRADGSQSVKGEPLVKNRFPLEKLALLEKMQGTGALTTQNKDDIARYFGLDAVNDSAGYYRHWSYPTVNAKYPHTAGTILSLSDVALKGREPDFFEMLQAGIFYGSLAQNGRADTASDISETSSVLQILRIGASIIDQWDADNYPTTITSSLGDVYGIEDLPYINKLLFTFSGPGAIAATDSPTYKGSIAFQLWNPHQSLSSNTGAYPDIQLSPVYSSGAATASNSDNYRLGLVITTKNASGATTSPTWYWNGKTAVWSTGASNEYFGDLPGGGVVSIPTYDPTTAYREPTLTSSISFRDMTGLPPSTSVVNSLTFSQAMASSTAKYLYFQPAVTYRIQFRESPGSATYHTYGTYLGMDSTSSYRGFTIAPWLSLSNAAKSGWYALPKSDPRTGRFGSGQNTSEYDLTSANYSLTPGPVASYTGVYGRLDATGPFASASGSTNPYRLDLWAANSASGGTNGKLVTNPAYADKDTVVRPGDSFYGGTTTNPLYQTISGTSTTGSAAGQQARPVVLNRPFRSVGELGYAFRDMPWKTLDFFSASSADAALLDLFSLNGSQPILAGRLNPNTRQKNVLTAVLAGAMQASGGTGTTVSSANAGALAGAVITLSTATPFSNRAELVTRLMNDPSLAKVSTVKTEREAVVRALADGSNTRTWNLLVDLVAQAGRYPSTARNLDQFVVEAERHYWLHVAIDRYTGQVVDKQLEVVRE